MKDGAFFQARKISRKCSLKLLVLKVQPFPTRVRVSLISVYTMS